jgi:NADH-quinone oxidoreductase subunit N
MYALIIVALLGILLLYIGLFKKTALLMPVGIAGLVGAFLALGLEANMNASWFNKMLLLNDLALAFIGAMIFFCIIIFMFSREYYKGVSEGLAEYYALFCFSLVGAMLLTSFTNLIMLFLGVEIMSIPLYILAGSKKTSLRSNEASFKYFLMGSFASAFLLLGITLIYGFTASFFLSDIKDFLVAHQGNMPFTVKTGILFVLFGLAFKLAASPFHFWTPDVYEGAPSLVSTYMATIVKMGSFAALWRLFSLALIPVSEGIQITLWVLAFLSMAIGNVTALWQQNFKRFIAYSGIGNTGFMLILFITGNPELGRLLLYYLFAYALSVAIGFFVFFVVKKNSGNEENLSIFDGLWYRNRTLAVAFMVALMSIAGIPVFAGFWAKYFVFYNAVGANLYALTILGIVLSLIAVYYYMRVVKIIISPPHEISPIKYEFISHYAIIVLTVAIIILGIYPFIFGYQLS